MNLSVLDIFKIGVGPSSSHTMGPMNAAAAFADDLERLRSAREDRARSAPRSTARSRSTGRGHCTDRAMLLGLEGHRPHTVDPAAIEPTLEHIRASGRLRLAGRHEIAFDEPLDLLFHRDQTLPLHPNGMRFTALGAAGEVLHREEFFSTGGGFIVRAAEFGQDPDAGKDVAVPLSTSSPAPTCSASAGTKASSCTSLCLRTSGVSTRGADARGAAPDLVGR